MAAVVFFRRRRPFLSLLLPPTPPQPPSLSPPTKFSSHYHWSLLRRRRDRMIQTLPFVTCSRCSSTRSGGRFYTTTTTAISSNTASHWLRQPCLRYYREPQQQRTLLSWTIPSELAYWTLMRRSNRYVPTVSTPRRREPPQFLSFSMSNLRTKLYPLFNSCYYNHSYHLLPSSQYPLSEIMSFLPSQSHHQNTNHERYQRHWLSTTSTVPHQFRQ